MGRDDFVTYKFLIPALIIAAFLLSRGTAAANGSDTPILPSITYEYYDIDASDADTIVDKAFKATPIRIGGTKFLGQASCSNSYSYKSEKSGGSCRPRDHEYELKCVVTLPRFVGAGREVEPKLDAFMERVRFHEQNHCDYFTEYTNRFIQWLKQPRDYGCGSMTNNIRTAFNKMNNELSAFQKKYDKDTLHGRTEGADLEWHLATEEERLLMGEEAVAPAVKVKPEIKYEYYDFAVNAKTNDWRHAEGGFGWSLSNSYKPRRKIDETCRVMKYEVLAVCEIKLPRFKGADEGLTPLLAEKVESIKREQLARCDLVTAEADRFVEKISGPAVFHCDRINNEIRGLLNQTVSAADKAVKELGLEARKTEDAKGAEGLVTPKIEYKYYDVSLKAGDDPFKAALAKKAYARGGGKSFPSALEWKIGYELAGRTRADASCGVGSYEVVSTCVIHLPRFNGQDSDLVGRGDALAEKLKDLELKACEQVTKRAELFGDWLAEDRSFPCPSMSNRVSGEYNRFFKESRGIMDEYESSLSWEEPQ